MGSIANGIRGAVQDVSRLEVTLSEVHQQYRKHNALSAQNHDESCKYMPGGNTRTVLHANPFPLTFARGHGCKLISIDGDEYTDFLGEYTAGIYGHDNPVIKAAVHETLEKGWNFGGHSLYEKRLAQTVCERFPALELVRFTNSGTEANMVALATAVVLTKRTKVLVFQKGYHGSVISGRTPSGKLSLNLPHDFVVAPYNDVDATRSLVDSLPPNSLAAIIVEPMLGSGGCFLGSTDFLTYLRDIATKLGALLIFDEVMTSRLGYHGLGKSLNIQPDLMTLGKWVGGGMSFGAFGGRKEIMRLFDPNGGQLEHPGTFNNNVLSMAAGTAGCKLLDREVIQELNTLGEIMKSLIEDVLLKHSITAGLNIPNAPVLDNGSGWPKMFVKGMGSLLCIHFTGPQKDILQAIFYHHMLRNKIYMAQRGFIALNIKLTETDVEHFVQATDQFCTEFESALKHES